MEKLREGFLFAKLIPELVVKDIHASQKFWRDLCGFSIAYDRPEEGFAFLEREGMQVMLDQAADGHNRWSTGIHDYPMGRGINFQMEVENIDHLVSAFAEAEWPLFMEPEEKWYRAGDKECGNRQFLVQDPDGYLLRFMQDLGTRPIP